MVSGQQERLATPLVLPNNSNWNEETGEYTTIQGVERKFLEVQQKALDKLKEIKGDVCVVSIAGPCRQGKSYILSKAFGQGQVFPLGHEMDPETMGIWMWIVPEKFRDNNDREFTVVLLDSEGIDAVSSEGISDNSIFTLSVLLSSIMIYNSNGVPKRSDLEGLDFIVQLSQRIQLHTNATEQEEKLFFEAFPYFIWLLRDVVLALPKECKNIREYFNKKVFKTEAKCEGQSKKAVESILTFFSGFDAFSLPPPSVDPSVLTNLDDETSAVNPLFRQKVEEFKAFLYPRLSPKKSINEGEFITGEALAVLTKSFVKALNTPGTVPNVQSAWNAFIDQKCQEVLDAALEEYKIEIMAELENLLPCDADGIRVVHALVIQKCHDKFKKETASLSIKSIQSYLESFTEKANPILSEWLDKNQKLTEEFCTDLIKKQKKEILDPVLARLRGPEGHKMEFGDIASAYNRIQQEYNSKARGAKEVQATVFLNFHPEIQEEMEHNIDLLKTLRDYDESLTREKEIAAQKEAERQRMEEENKRREEEARNKERELEVLRKKQEEEMIRLQEMFERTQKEQRDQIQNMIEAQLEEHRKEREQQLARQSTLEEKMEMLRLDAEKRENLFKEVIQNMREEYQEERSSMKQMYDKSMEAASARQEYLESTIQQNIEDQRKERASAMASQARLQETINKTIEENKNERAVAMAREKRLQETIKDKDTMIQRKQNEKEEMRDKHFMIRKFWK